jgi:hypothetical protein
MSVESPKQETIHRPYPPDEVPRMARPEFDSKENRPIVRMVDVGYGSKAFTMFDSGCTTESLSPEFVRVNKLNAKPLDEPVPLQLGTAGSKSSINFGLYAPVSVGGRSDDSHYFDVVNLDRYDCVIGTRGMHKLGLLLDFESEVPCVRVGDKSLPSLSEGEERAVIARRYSMRAKKAKTINN